MITIASNLHQKILSTIENKRQTTGPRLAVQISEPTKFFMLNKF